MSNHPSINSYWAWRKRPITETNGPRFGCCTLPHIYDCPLKPYASLPPTHHSPATAGQSFLSPSLSVRRCIKSTDWLPLSLPAEAKMQIHATLVGWRPQIYLLQALRVWSHRSSSSPAATWAAGSSGRHGHDCEQYTMRATLCI